MKQNIALYRSFCLVFFKLFASKEKIKSQKINWAWNLGDSREEGRIPTHSAFRGKEPRGAAALDLALSNKVLNSPSPPSEPSSKMILSAASDPCLSLPGQEFLLSVYLVFLVFKQQHSKKMCFPHFNLGREMSSYLGDLFHKKHVFSNLQSLQYILPSAWVFHSIHSLS